MSGKPQVFSDEENRVLRDALRKLREERDLTQADVGRLLGIKQQNAGRLLGASPNAGMSRASANALARELNYRDAEDMLIDRGVLAELKAVPTGGHWHDRDIAVRIARKLGYDEAAIQAVIARFREQSYQSKSMRWWNDRFVLEAMERATDEVSRVSAPPPAEETARPKRKKVARG